MNGWQNNVKRWLEIQVNGNFRGPDRSHSEFLCLRNGVLKSSIRRELVKVTKRALCVLHVHFTIQQT